MERIPFLPLDPNAPPAFLLSAILDGMRQSEINFSLSHFFDDGYRVVLGDDMNGWKGYCLVDTIDQAAAWFQQYAPVFWPNSKFAKTLAT